MKIHLNKKQEQSYYLTKVLYTGCLLISLPGFNENFMI